MLERYIESIARDGRAACVEDEQPDLAMRMLDFVTLGLRLREGLSLETLPRSVRQSTCFDLLGETGAWLLEMGFLAIRATAGCASPPSTS